LEKYDRGREPLSILATIAILHKANGPVLVLKNYSKGTLKVLLLAKNPDVDIRTSSAVPLNKLAPNLLRLWRDEGVPALTSSPPWCGDLKDTLIERGCHRSATEHAGFLHEEMAEFIENRFWTVLPYHLVRDLPQLQLSPAAVKEERERKPRILCNHSWYPVNKNTHPTACSP
jgi:hypothetical protein